MTSDTVRLAARPTWSHHERTRRPGFWVNVACAAFLIIVPLGIVALLLSQATSTYPGGDGSADCVMAGYPTNVDRCARQ